MKKGAFIVLAAVLIAGCNTIGVFEKTEAFTTHAWAAANKPGFSFTITDTAAFYNVYVVLRHTDAYRYNNIYINVSSTIAGDTTVTQQHNFVLANNTGWLGSAIDDVIEQRMAINSVPIRLKKGVYQVSLQQIMRDDPLENILNAGVRVEKVVQ